MSLYLVRASMIFFGKVTFLFSKSIYEYYLLVLFYLFWVKYPCLIVIIELECHNDHFMCIFSYWTWIYCKIKIQ